MSKKFLVNGVEVFVDETKFEELRKQFKENAIIDDLEGWQSTGAMERYTATTFLDKARHYLSQSPPDHIQSAEKTWFAAVYAVKQLFLSCGVDLKSHNALKFFCRFALKHSELPDSVFWNLLDCWTKAEKMHQDVYGSLNFRPSEYLQSISDVEGFVNELAKFDGMKLWAEFYKKFIVGSDPDVTVKKESRRISLGGFRFMSEYSVFV